ncbi:hypothetical protein [Leptothoe kymatousa]|uniref:Uncharacterized protein n=1 Tax=Leptothoe kymatousa TAU-MAC 1615 TaxID=2364775 RepID=A0ABS5Y532_9CYAN|nr:hypothetical protein [Leptothoe kymatousa]MBT9312942.1 hypothetical protein [Leptothoe kymatousa TAU-MAC 1615]
MSTNTNNNPTPQPTCQHKPGDVWEEGCCTSRQTAPQENQPVEKAVSEHKNSEAKA